MADTADLEPIGYDGMGAPIYLHQIDPLEAATVLEKLDTLMRTAPTDYGYL